MFGIVEVVAACEWARLEKERLCKSRAIAEAQGPEALAAWEAAEEKRRQDLREAHILRLREREVAALEQIARQGRGASGIGIFGAAIAGSVLGNLLVD